MTSLKQFVVYGSKQPTEKIPSPTIYKMTVYEKNEVCARSTFNALLKRKYKIKNSLLIKIDYIEEPVDNIHVFGIKLKLKARKRTINMYKEFRAVSKADAVSELYSDMAGRHSANRRMIDIISVDKVELENCRREKSRMFENEFRVFGKRVEECGYFVAEE